MGTYAGQRVARQIPLLERRINAVEDVWYTSDIATTITRIAIDDDDNLHIQIDATTVNKVNRDGVPFFAYAVAGNIIGFGGDGHVYTLETGAPDTIRFYDKDTGAFVDSWTFTGDFYHPSRALDGHVYATTAASPSDRVVTIHQLDATDGTETDTTTFTINVDDREHGLCTDDSGNVYVYTDELETAGNDRVRKYNSSLTAQSTTDLPNSYTEGDNLDFMASDATDVLAGYNDTTMRVFDLSDGSLDHTGTKGGANTVGHEIGGNLFVITDGDQFITEFNWSLTEINSFQVFELIDNGDNQTTFYRYVGAGANTLQFRQALGTPDGGASIPALGAYDAIGAAGILTLTANAGNTETVTINGTTRTFKTTITTVNDVLIGANAGASIDNLIASLNGDDGAGTLYHADTVAHTTVRATAGAGDTMVASAIANTSATDAYATTETLTNGSWGGATMGDQRPHVPFCVAHTNEVVNMRDAIEAVAPFYRNAVTGNPFNWTDASADNLYHVAVTPNTYDWQADFDMVRELDLNEIDSCLDKLEASDTI